MISGSVMNIIRAQRRYCPTSGSFTPRLSRICSRTSGGIVRGRFAVGSEGDSFTIMKMMKLMKIRAGTARTSRRMMYVTMASPRSGWGLGQRVGGGKSGPACLAGMRPPSGRDGGRDVMSGDRDHSRSMPGVRVHSAMFHSSESQSDMLMPSRLAAWAETPPRWVIGMIE